MVILQIVYRSAEGDRELDIELRHPQATLAEVITAVRGHRPDALWVDGHPVAVDRAITDTSLREGSVLADVPGEVRGGAQGPEIAVVAGRAAGRSEPLVLGCTQLGRAPERGIALGDPATSRHHCDLHLDPSGALILVDTGSRHGTAVDGRRVDPGTPVPVPPGATIELGDSVLRFHLHTGTDRPRPGPAQPTGPSGTVPFNRPPRIAPPPAPAPLAVPAPPAETHKPELSIAALVGPLLLAGAAVAISGNAQFALLAVLSPIVAAGAWFESRRRALAKDGGAQQGYAQQLAALTDAVIAANAEERARRWHSTPDMPEILRRAALPSVQLWERRPHHPDFLDLHAGVASLPWFPPLEGASSATALPDQIVELAESHVLHAVPVDVPLGAGGVLGIVGERDEVVALARGLLCQAAVLHGPADLTIGVFTDTERRQVWEWAKWLPHTLDVSEGRRWLGVGPEQSDETLRRLAPSFGSTAVLVVLDDDALIEGKEAPARDVLRRSLAPLDPREPTPRVTALVLTSSPDRLPAACTTVVEVSQGRAVLRRPDEGRWVRAMLPARLSSRAARTCARDLARFDDSDLDIPGGSLPDLVRLLPLLELEHIDGDTIRRGWAQARHDTHPVVPLGMTERGLFEVDLVKHGPHGLIGGTPGSGKSEMLRTLVVGLATKIDPEHLTFALIDYKGGATFDECARLPHTVGMATDLDEQLGERALRALEAEVSRRERILREAEVMTIENLMTTRPDLQFPRLLVIIDEYAEMAAALPDLLTSLVGIARRGRTLGVHLILAAQRPAAAINDEIRANTQLRIALRVEDPEDSKPIIDQRDAADIPPTRKGRAYVRLGGSEVLPVQTALVTCTSQSQAGRGVDVAAFRFGPSATSIHEDSRGASGSTDLTRLVDAIVDAHRLTGAPPPRRPWPEPLTDRTPLTALLPEARSAPTTALVALADDIARQSQYPVGWDLTEGALLLAGVPGSGTTTTLLAIALSLAHGHPPDRLEIHALDHGAGELGVLTALPHVGSVVAGGERERHGRLLRYLRDELERRRLDRSDPDRRRIVLLIDNLAALRAEAADDAETQRWLDTIGRLVVDGVDVGISVAMSVDRIDAVPTRYTLTQRWLFRLADRHDYPHAGVNREDIPPAVAGRAAIAGSGLHIQIGFPEPSIESALAAVIAEHPHDRRVAPQFGVLATTVATTELDLTARVAPEPWLLPVGLAETDLSSVGLELYEGEHALVAGPARSGKTTTLAALATVLRAAAPHAWILGMGTRRSPLRDCPSLDHFAQVGGEAAGALAALHTRTGPVLLLIDDAETIDDDDGAIASLLGAQREEMHIVAAARAEALSGIWNHWTKKVLMSKTGILLSPNVDTDSTLFNVMLPRRGPMPPGRGYLIANGDLRVIQVATPPS